MTFRIHFLCGDKVDVQADSPDEARKAASRVIRGSRIIKTKVIKA